MHVFSHEALVFFFFFYILPFGIFFIFQRPHKATAEEMTKYHSDDYIKFLRSIRPDNMSEFSKQMQRCKSEAGALGLRASLDLYRCPL